MQSNSPDSQLVPALRCMALCLALMCGSAAAQPAAELEALETAAQRGDVNIVHWRDNGYAYAFAGAIDNSRLQALADRVWRELARSS